MTAERSTSMTSAKKATFLQRRLAFP